MADTKIKCEKCLHQFVCERKTCAECQGSGCGECELYDLYNGVPYIEDCEDFIDADLINRQQTKIERLKYNLEAVLNERADHSEAIKEYKNNVENDIITLLSKSNCTEFIECLDYRYKEMVSEE